MSQAPTPPHRRRLGNALVLALAALLAVGILWTAVTFAADPGLSWVDHLFHDPNACGGG